MFKFFLQGNDKIVKRFGVDITPLTYVPGGRIERYLGNLNFFFIRESTSIRENGGISGFVHSFITEVSAATDIALIGFPVHFIFCPFSC